MKLSEILQSSINQHGESLGELSQQTPQLVVFLRHSGCPFCKEVLAVLRKDRTEIEQQGVQIVLVHMMADNEAQPFFKKYQLDDLSRFADADQKMYRAFGLVRGKISQVMGPAIWWNGFKSVILKGHLPSKPIGDIYQMPGTFLLWKEEVIQAHRPTNSSDLPNFTDLAACPLPGKSEG